MYLALTNKRYLHKKIYYVTIRIIKTKVKRGKYKMQKFSTWMILSLAVIFWLLRIAATYTYVMGMDFIVEPLSLELEISLLFIALLAFVLLAKRKMLGAIIYIIAYDGYFGVDIFNKFIAYISIRWIQYFKMCIIIII